MASSGDLLADRRFAWAEGALREGDAPAAADLAAQALERAPVFPAAWFLLGQAREREAESHAQGPDRDALLTGAREAFQAALAHDPADVLGAGVRLAQLGVGDPATAMSQAYVRTLFDDYAVRFDRHLVKGLRYRAPELLHDAVRRACSMRLRPFGFAAMLDLGCGTGLGTAPFRPVCGLVAGVDLSPAMVKRANAKRLFDELAADDILPWLARRPPRSADLVLAADVFVYIGDLAPVFAASARVLRSDGLLAFTVQATSEEGAVLGADGRFAHGERYLRTLAAEAGLAIVLLEAASTRQDRGLDVPGLLAVMRPSGQRTA